MTSFAATALCLLSLASSAGALDFSFNASPKTGSSSRGVSPVMMVPFGLQNSISKSLNLQGAADLKGLGASFAAPRVQGGQAEMIPQLPESAVSIIEEGRTITLPQRAALTGNAQADASEFTRATPEAEQSVTPALKNVRQELDRKTERLEKPLAAVEGKAGGEANPSEIKRLGQEIWDIMVAPVRDGRPILTGRSGYVDGHGRGDGKSSASESSLASSEGRGHAGRELPMIAKASSEGSAQTLIDEKNAGRDSQGPGEGRTTPATRRDSRAAQLNAVSLITMDVVGQSLILSDHGMSAEGLRRAALEVRAAGLSIAADLESIAGKLFAMNLPSSSGSRDSTRSGSSGAALFQSSGDASSFKTTSLSGTKTSRAFAVPAPQSGPGFWSWAAILPLLLLGLAALPEYR